VTKVEKLVVRYAGRKRIYEDCAVESFNDHRTVVARNLMASIAIDLAEEMLAKLKREGVRGDK
jgi:hypothetical protein